MALLSRMVGAPLTIDIGPGAVDWAEVDDHRDLERAREIACRC